MRGTHVELGSAGTDSGEQMWLLAVCPPVSILRESTLATRTCPSSTNAPVYEFGAAHTVDTAQRVHL